MIILAAFLAVAEPERGSRPSQAQQAPARADSPLDSTKQDQAATDVDEVIVFAPKIPKEPDWSKKLDLNPRGDFSIPDQPYLRQRPLNGCKSMAGGATSPAGKSGAAAGMVCAWRF
jgi:hypothetical protein